MKTTMKRVRQVLGSQVRQVRRAHPRQQPVEIHVDLKLKQGLTLHLHINPFILGVLMSITGFPWLIRLAKLLGWL